MSFNLSQLSVDERNAIQQHRQHCLVSHQQQQDLAIDTAWEFSRLLNARAELNDGWRDWVCQQLLALDDPQLVERLTQRLSGYIRGAGQSTPLSEQD